MIDCNPTWKPLQVSLAVLVGALVLVLPRPCSGQQSVFGAVVESDSSAPVAGAMVVLLVGDRVVGRVLSADNGSFALEVEAPGRYQLRVDRIGYASTFSGIFDIGSGVTVERSIETEVKPVQLRGLEVVGGERCEVRPQNGLATATVWEEARKALEAAVWTSDRELYQFTWLRLIRELDRTGDRILNEARSRQRFFTPQPFVSVDPDSLAQRGYLLEDGHDVRYAAPDATVLLSDSFLDGHCFTLDWTDRDGRRLVGLRFEPLGNRDVPDVEGVLWLDETRARLSSLEYRYVNLQRRVIRGDDASGSILFRGLPNGTWVVQEWSIRMPRLREVRDEFGRVVWYEVTGYVEEGGVVSQVATATGRLLDEAATPGVISGIVADSSGAPSMGARVWVEGTAFEARSDELGRFEFEGLSDGTWSVGASVPTLTGFGHRGTYVDVRVQRDVVSEATVTLPSVRALAMERCRSTSPAVGDAILIGRVLDREGEPVPGAEVRTLWTPSRQPYSQTFDGSGLQADEQGVFTACAVPQAQTVLVDATADGGVAGAAEVRVPESEDVVSVEVRLGSGPERRIRSSAEEIAPELAREDAQWLTAIGFDLRSGQALLHRTEADILASRYDSLAGMLLEIPRLEVRPLLTGQTEFRLHATADWALPAEPPYGCELEFYLNGSLVRQRLGDNWDLALYRMLDVRYLTAIEMFEGRLSPVGTPDSCGAVLLWVSRLRDREDPEFVGRVQGQVVHLRDDSLEAGIGLTLQPGGHEARTDQDGRFDFGALPPAFYRLEASVPGWGQWSTEIQLRAGAVAEVVIEIEGDPWTVDLISEHLRISDTFEILPPA